MYIFYERKKIKKLFYMILFGFLEAFLTIWVNCLF